MIGRIAGDVIRAAERSGRQAQYRQQCADQAQSMRAELRTGSTAVATRTAAVATTREPVSGADTLSYIRQFLQRMCVWPNQASLTAATLYIAQAHAKDKDGLPVWEYCARFLLTSEEGGSGKSRMAKTMGLLCPNAEMLVDFTKASLIDLIAEPATVIITEANINLVGNKVLVRICNSGYEQGPKATRKMGGKTVKIPLAGSMILDGLNTIVKDRGIEMRTLVSRCIVAQVHPAPVEWQRPRMNRQVLAVAEMIRNRAAAWMAQEVANNIGEYIPELPEGLGNRPAALWEPLLAVADAAGGDWPSLAREACVHLESALDVQDEDEDGQSELDRIIAAWNEED